MNCFSSIALLLAVSLTAPFARAEGTDTAATNKANVDLARERFQRAVSLYREGNFDAALAEFQRAYELQPNYRVLYNLGQVQVERHDAVAAIKLFREYLNRGGSEIDPERRAQVERDLNLLTTRVAELRVEINERGVSLLVDGVAVAELPSSAPIIINSGVHQISVTKPGFQAQARSVSVPGGEPLSLRFSLEPDPAARPVPRAPKGADTDSNDNHSLGTPFWVGVASTVALAGTATTFGFLTRKADHDLDSKFDRLPGDASAISRDRDHLKTYALLTDVFAGAAIVAAGVTVYFAASGSKSVKSVGATPRGPQLRAGFAGTQLLLRGDW